MERKQHDPARAAHQRSRAAEVWVRGYVDKMTAWPAPKFVCSEPDHTDLVAAVGARRAARMMHGYMEEQI